MSLHVLFVLSHGVLLAFFALGNSLLPSKGKLLPVLSGCAEGPCVCSTVRMLAPYHTNQGNCLWTATGVTAQDSNTTALPNLDCMPVCSVMHETGEGSIAGAARLE